MDNKELIAEARQAVLSMDYARAYQYGLVGRLADALEESERERDGALRAMNTHSCGESAEASYRRTLKAEAERDTLAATLERVRSLLGELDLDSGRVTAPGTAWGSILREALALASAPSVARPIPDREAIARALAEVDREVDLDPHVPDFLPYADAVLAAIGTTPVVSDDTEWEYAVGQENSDGSIEADDFDGPTRDIDEARMWVDEALAGGTYDNAILVGKPVGSPWVAIEKGAGE